MGGIRFSVCGCQSDNPFVCFDTKPTQRACAQDLPRNGRTREGRSQRTFGRRGQSREGQPVEGSRRDQSAEQVSQGDESRAERRPVNRSQKSGC